MASSRASGMLSAVPSWLLPWEKAAAGPNRAVWAALILAAALTAAFLAGHVPYIAATPDGIDSANFTLAIERYDPRQHQPHPPGFPVHIAVGRLIHAAYDTVTVSERASDAGSATAALRMWSVISGALAVFSTTVIAIALGASPRRGVLAAALTATCPLFWITAMRPLSDVPGLCFSMLSQAAALAAYGRITRHQPVPVAHRASFIAGLDYRLLAAAAIAGIAVGVRVQTALLTVPLLAMVTIAAARRRGPAPIVQVPAALLFGMVAWAMPMTMAVGGVGEYVRLLTTVAADDFAGVEMVATNPNARLIALALLRTFIVPWSSTALGFGVLLLSVLGAIALARHGRRPLLLLAVMGAPYLAFHVLFQESESIRYALPLVPVCSLLIVAGCSSRPLMTAVCAGMLLISGSLSLSAASAYGRSESPAARVAADIRRRADERRPAPVLAYHHAVGRALRGQRWPGTQLPAEVRYEWLALARYWLEGGRGPVWFLADGRRTDLALIDPAARREIRSYRWPVDVEPLLGGAQPLAITWHEIDPPGWFLMRGWSLTAETHGLSRRDGDSPGTSPVTGYVRRRGAAAVMMVAGRNPGNPFDTGATVELAVDGRPRAAWTVSPQSAFHQRIAFAPGELLGAGPYATVTVRAWDAAGTARLVDVAIEHFDIQSPGAAMVAPGGGWHIPELDPTSGRTWRWAEEQAELRAEGFGHDVELVIRGESPLRYFQTAPRLVIKAGATEVASLTPMSDFEWVVPIPAKTLAAAYGRLWLESNRWFIPDELHGNGDRRRLALRIFDVSARPRPAAASARRVTAR